MIGEGRTGDHTIYRARATAKARGLERFRDQSDISLCALRLRSQRAASDHFPSLSSPSFSPFDTFPTLAGRCIISISAASSFTPILPRRYSPLINLTDETRMKYEKKKINDSPLYQRFFPRSVSSSFFSFRPMRIVFLNVASLEGSSNRTCLTRDARFEGKENNESENGEEYSSLGNNSLNYWVGETTCLVEKNKKRQE